MKNIFMLTHFYPSHRGGIEIAAYQTAKNITLNSDFQIIWAASNSDKPPFQTQQIKYIPINSINFIEKILPFPYPIPKLSAIFTIYKNVKKADIIHIHDFLYLSNILGFIFAKMLKKKILITQHIGFIPYKNKILRLILSTLNKTLGKYILSKSDSTVFISHTVMEYFSKICNNTKNFHFIPNSTDDNIYCVRKPEERKLIRDNYNLKSITFLFVGRFTEKKGLNIIKQFAQHFPNYDFILAGWGMINPNSWKLNNVRVYNNLIGKDIADLYNAADFLILPSYGEGFPLVVQEALACGLDLIVSDEIINGFNKIEIYVSLTYKNNTKADEYFENILEVAKNYLFSYSSRLEKSNFAKENWSPNLTGKKYINLLG
jgi:glycosyltransferase involved in cell wall biosynthesis